MTHHEPDPFTFLYDAMAASFKEHRLKLIDWNSTRNPQPDTVSEADLPEWQIRPGTIRGVLGNISCGTSLERDYSIVINTGEMVLGARLHPIEWILLGVLHRWKYGALETVKWKDRSFVDRVEITSATTGISDPLTNRQILGWSALWIVTVHMLFPSDDLYGVSL